MKVKSVCFPDLYFLFLYIEILIKLIKPSIFIDVFEKLDYFNYKASFDGKCFHKVKSKMSTR